MTLPATNSTPSSAGSSRDRSSLLVIASVTAVLAGLHLADHVIRGEHVRQHGLDEGWNHSGWPFQPSFSPFSFSLIAVAAILLGGIAFTLRGRLWAGYWLIAAVALGALVTQVHLIPTADQESPSVIYHSWVGNPLLGALAVINTFAIIVSLIVMGANAYRVGRRSRRWW